MAISGSSPALCRSWLSLPRIAVCGSRRFRRDRSGTPSLTAALALLPLKKPGWGLGQKKKRAEKARKITGTRLCCRAGRPRVAWWLPDVFPVSVGCPASLASLPCSVGCRRLALLSVGPAIFGETGVERRPSQLPLHCCPCPVSHVYRDFCLLRPLPLGWAAALVVVSVGVGQAMSPGPLLRGALRLLVSPCVVFKLRPESTC